MFQGVDSRGDGTVNWFLMWISMVLAGCLVPLPLFGEIILSIVEFGAVYFDVNSVVL